MKLTASGIVKTFGGTVALDNVGLELVPGQIHALVGENGAGKSTFLKILAGVELPNSGSMLLDDKPYAPTGIKDAERQGVALVFQEVTINTSLGIAENIFIDRLREFTRFGMLDAKKMRQRAQEILDSFSADISARQSLMSLDLGKWKCIEIARALSLSPKFLFLDESTAFLNHREVGAVLDAMRNLKNRGIGIAFVSHHLNEVKEVADSLTILKDGRWIGDYRAAEITTEGIQEKMVGRDLSGGIFPAKASVNDRKPVLALSGISTTPRLEVKSLDLREGEIVGVAGLKGAGGVELIEIVAGARIPEAGAMTFAGKPYRPSSPKDAWKAGIALLPGDRTREGLLMDFSVMDNLVLPKPPRRNIFFNRSAAAETANDLVKRILIKTKSIHSVCRSLSGGNLQKVVLGKCLSVTPRVLLLDNPTRGVDVGARLEIYRIIRDLAEQGMAILMVSEDMPELLGLSDRLLVLRAGKVTRLIENEAEMTENEIIRHMT